MCCVKILIFSLFFVKCTAMFEGDDCIVMTDDWKAGKCTTLDKCDYAKNISQSNQNSQACGLSRQHPLVCCPIASTPLPPASRSEDMCKQYYHIRAQVTGVAHGEKAQSKEFPHMAAIGYKDRNTTTWLCGGTLISDQFVLTAAHCINTRTHGTPQTVRLGDLDLATTTEDANPDDIRVSKIFTHEGFRLSSHYNDIALLKLEKKIKFGRYIKPACLHTKKELPSDVLQATGWGKTDYFGDTSSHLMKVSLKVIDHETCAKRYGNVPAKKLKSGINDDSQICAGDDVGSDTCNGDSGGPLHYLNQGDQEMLRHFVVVGVTSFGKGCGFEYSAGVYTRVSSFVTWIEDIVWPIPK